MILDEYKRQLCQWQGPEGAWISVAIASHPDLIRKRRRAENLAPGQSRAATVMLMRVNRRRLGKKVAGKYEKEGPQ